MCFDSADSSEFSDNAVVKCRVDHVCEECNSKIQRGDLAFYLTGKTEGEFYSMYLCGQCESTRFRIHEHEIAEGCMQYESWCPIGDLVEYCRDTGFDRETTETGQIYLRE